MFKWLNRFKKKKMLFPKNPMDYTLTDSSTEWEFQSYCPQCKSITNHAECMSSICINCGYFAGFGGLLYKSRVHRKIFNGAKWVHQYKYGNGSNEYEIEDMIE